MNIILEVPEDIARSLGENPRLVERTALESLAIESVRSGRLSRGQVRRLLGFQTRYELEEFLKARHVPVQESMGDVTRDCDLVLTLGGR